MNSSAGHSWWGITPLLALALLGPRAVTHTTASGPAAQAPAPAVLTVAAPPLSFPSGAPSPVLRQTGSREWETTVLLDDTDPNCSGVSTVSLTVAGDRLARSTRPLAAEAPDLPRSSSAMWELATTEPDSETAGKPVAVEKGPDPATPIGSACEVTVAFTGMRQVPQTAMLILDQAAASSSIPLTVSRDVTLWYYLGIPAVAGGVLAVLTFLLAVLFVGSNPQAERLSFRRRQFWARPITASGAWTLNDSWATNITSGLVAVGTVLAATTAASSLFPGVSLDRFAIVNIVAGAIVIAAPVVFGILYAQWSRRNPGVPADAMMKLPPDEERATISVPSGASVTMLGDAGLGALDGTELVGIRSGCTIQVPPGGEISVPPGASMTDPGGTDISVHAGAPIVVGGISGPVTLAQDDMFSVTSRRTTNQAAAEADRTFEYPVRIKADGGIRITVTGVADVTIPAGTVIQPASGRSFTLPREKHLVTPTGSNMMAANLFIVLFTSLITTFGIGAEIGLASVLAFGLSEADLAWRSVMLGVTVLVGLLVLWYSVTAIGALADPQPGSSMSATSGNSFTL